MSDQPGERPIHVAPPPVPSDIGIVAALPIEVGPLLGRLREVRKYAGARHTVHEGFCGEQLVSLIITGPGRQAAARGAEVLIVGHRPRWLVSVGFAGALDPNLKRNTLLIPDRIMTPQGDVLKIDIQGTSHDAGVQPSHSLVTVDHIVRTAHDKAELFRSTGADAVDMETHAVASLACDRGVRFLSVRVISDEASTDLPPEVLTLVGPTGGYRVGAAIGAIWKRPSSMKDMLILRDNANLAAKVLADSVPEILQRLTGP